MKTIKSLSVFVFIAALLFNVSCRKDQAEQLPTKPKPTPEAPELPPKASFVMDYSSFDGAKTVDERGHANVGYAKLNVLFWNAVLIGNLAVPVAAFNESFQHQPQHLGNLKWLWSYEVVVKGQTYQAKLYGQVMGQDIEWKMYVSKEGDFADFLWYEGIMNQSYQQIEWVIYQSPANPVPYFTINYLNDELNGKQSIRYTQAEEIVTQASYIEHGNLTGGDFDRYYTIYLQGDDKLTEIEWNYTHGNGHVRDAVHFKDTQWHCWDEQQLDVECP